VGDRGTGLIAGPSPVAVTAGLGALWGLGGYALLWGHTPVVITRSFVVSLPGTLLLLPIRLVLWGIRFVEDRVVDRSFDFSRSNAWIGGLAGLVGAALAVGTFLAARWVVRRIRARRAADVHPVATRRP
jgi:hypothetical protein